MREWIISASVLILIISAVRYLLRGRIKPLLQYALWLPVLIRLLLPLSFGSSAMSVANLAPQGSDRAAELIVVLWSGEKAGQSEDYGAGAAAESVNPGSTDENPAFSLPKIDPARAGGLIWLAGAALVLLCTGLSNGVFMLRLRRGRRALRTRAALPVYIFADLRSPCLAGFVRPAIYVTPELVGKEEQLEHVIQHETAHFRHGDHIWSLLRCLCVALHWYNPLVWLAAALSKRDGELACDEAVISRIGEEQRFAYGRTLISLSGPKPGRLLDVATTMSDSKRGIKERISLLSNRPPMRLATLLLVLAVALAAVGCTFTGEKAPAESPTPVPTGTESQAPAAEPAPLSYTDSFDSADGLVRYTADFEEPAVALETMPIVEAGLHEFSEDEARDVAKLIFGDNRLRQAGINEYSKEEIEEYLSVCQLLRDDEELLAKLNNDPQMDGERVRGFYAEYAAAGVYEAAPYERDAAELKWEYVNEGNGSNSIRGKTRMGAYNYSFSAAKNQQNDNVLNGVYAMMEVGRLAQMPYEYYTQYQLAYESVPDRQQIDMAMAEAERIISGLPAGLWEITSCEARQLMNGRYNIWISASPVVVGFTVSTTDNRLGGVRNESVSFRFGRDATLIYFSSINPCEKLGYISEGESIISFERAMELAKATLQEADGWNFDQIYSGMGEELFRNGSRSEVAIDAYELGFNKQQAEGESTYRLMPCINLRGHYETYDEAGELVYSSGENALILCLDAIDGKLLYMPNMQTAQ